MKKLIILAVLLVCVSVAVAADIGKMETDGKGQTVQGAAPRTVTALTGASYTTDGTGMWWNVYCAADSQARIMPTSAKGSNVQFTIPATTWTGWVINKAAPFVNISGCTGRLLRQ